VCLPPYTPLPHASVSALDQDDVVFFEQKVRQFRAPCTAWNSSLTAVFFGRKKLSDCGYENGKLSTIQTTPVF
jgi:hypothetical protein